MDHPTRPAHDRLRLLLVVASVRRGRADAALLPWVRDELTARPDVEVDVLDLADVR